MRDCTRGGVATVLCEWAEATRLGILAEEEALPRDPGVESVADLLGFDFSASPVDRPLIERLHTGDF